MSRSAATPARRLPGKDGLYYAADRETAEYLAGQIIEKYAEVYPAMARCFQEDLDACLPQAGLSDTSGLP